jgi:hypothetical protein
MPSRETDKDPKNTGGLASTFSSTVAAVRNQGKIDDSAVVDKNRAMKNYQMEDPPGLPGDLKNPKE